MGGTEREENNVFEQWRSSTGEARDAKLRELVTLLRIHAQAVVYAKLQQHRPEIVAEAVWLAISKAPQFRGESKFSTWFHRIVLNQVSLALREKQKRSPEKAIEELTQEEARQLSAELDFVSSVAIQELLEGLSESDLQMVHMRYEGLTWLEIANLLGITHEAARLRWAHLRGRILRNLAKRGTDGSTGAHRLERVSAGSGTDAGAGTPDSGKDSAGGDGSLRPRGSTN